MYYSSMGSIFSIFIPSKLLTLVTNTSSFEILTCLTRVIVRCHRVIATLESMMMRILSMMMILMISVMLRADHKMAKV